MPINFTGYRDGNDGLMQALRVGHTGKTTVLNIGATATSVTTTSPIVRLVATPVAAAISCGGATMTLAATDDMFLPASVVEYVVVDRGQQVSVKTATGGNGSLYVTEVL